ncbi:MAG TPA: phosphoribosylanthranilate isomerase [Thermoanaerobaculia bacterium]|nr:phosphoribosylanthranilate isomerase [Thermoanaerobaculia bacterium]
MTRIKICGITREDDALFCAAQGADFLGFIFVPLTPRFIEPERAAAIAARVREAEHPPKIVGVFRDSGPEYIATTAATVGLDLVQLHGAESNDMIAALGVPAIKTFRISDEPPDTSDYPDAAWVLFDTYDKHIAGGTGRRFDWSVLAAYGRNKPFFLSGGINPDNIAAAISLVRPDAIDLSSGVESAPGIKDHGKLRMLFTRVVGGMFSVDR